MTVVLGSIQLGNKSAAWFAANPTVVLLDGQVVYLDDQSGQYKKGDGVTQLSALSFLGGGSQTLAQTLALGNTTGANNIVVDDGDTIRFGTSSFTQTTIGYDSISARTVISNSVSGDYVYIKNGGGIDLYSGANGINFSTATNYLSVLEGIGVVSATNSNATGFSISETSNIFRLFAGTELRFDAATVTLYQLTANTVPYLGASKEFVSSAVTPTELGYVSGVTSSIQTQINALQTGQFWKAACRVATTAPGTLATDFENGDTIDGVVLSTGDRILIKNQASGIENGIYIVAASGAPTRATDFDNGADNLSGATVSIQEGTTNAEKKFTCSTNNPITIGATNITFIDAGGLAYLGTTNRISVTGNVIDIDANYVGQSSITTLGTITTGTWNATTIGVAYGGTGLTSVTANRILYASGTNTWGTSASLNFNGTGLLIGDGTMYGTQPLEISRASLGSNIFLKNNLTSGKSALYVGDSTLTAGVRFQYCGSAFASSGIEEASSCQLFATGTSTNLNIGTYASAGELRFYTNNTKRATIDASGYINLGTYGTPSAQRLVTIGDASAWVSIGSRVGTATAVAFYANQGTPSSSNWFLRADSTTDVLMNSPGGALTFQTNNTNRYVISGTKGEHTWTTGAASSSATTYFNWTAGNSITQTASTAIPKAKMTLGTCQWSTGALAATQKAYDITQPTMSFVGASTATLAATLGISGAYDAGTNATITTSVGLLIESAAVNSAGTVTTAYGAYINAPSGAGTNYALGLAYDASNYVAFAVSSAGVATITANGASARFNFANKLSSTHPTGGIGYNTGAGGTVTQATSKSTGVTLNKVCGQITMNNAALAGGATVIFTLTNSAISTTDNLIVAHASGGTFNSYTITYENVTAGTVDIVVTNKTGGSLSEAIVINYAIIKGVTS